MDNKSRFLAFAKAAALIVWALVAIITSAGVWNATAGSTPDGFVCTVAGLNLIVSGVAIYLVAKKILFKDEK